MQHWKSNWNLDVFLLDNVMNTEHMINKNGEDMYSTPTFSYDWIKAHLARQCGIEITTDNQPEN